MTGVLAGKVAFVAGASRGIGATVAEALAREGAAVAVAARSEQEGKVPGTIHAVVDRITSAGGRALPVQCDVTSEESVEAAVAQTVSEFGSIDILVARCRPRRPAPGRSRRPAESVTHHPPAQGRRGHHLVTGVEEDLQQPDRASSQITVFPGGGSVG